MAGTKRPRPEYVTVEDFAAAVQQQLTFRLDGAYLELVLAIASAMGLPDQAELERSVRSQA